MSAPRNVDGLAPRHRQRLPRERRCVRFDLAPDVYAKLIQLGKADLFGRPESAVATVERLIRSAHAKLSAA